MNSLERDGDRFDLDRCDLGHPRRTRRRRDSTARGGGERSSPTHGSEELAECSGETRVVDVAKDFSRTPGPRYRADGPFSGEEFREDFLLPR